MNLQTKSKLGWPILIALSIIPVILWCVAYPIHFRFLGPTAMRTFSVSVYSLGQVLGLVGMAMFALNFVLSARVKWIEDIFGGMNKVYIAHHILGGLSFVFLLFHPILLAAKYLPQSKTGAIALFYFTADYTINFGIIALGLMILFLVLTFFVKLPYQIWKFTHKFLGLAFFFASLHVLLIPSDVTTFRYLQYYMWLLVAMGGISILYRTLLAFLLVPKEPFVIEQVTQVSPSIWEVTMRHAKGKAFRFTPGQFIFIRFPKTPGLEEVHPFSISSAPKNNTVSIGVKALGDFTSRFGELKPGMEAEIEGPFGRSSYVYYPNKKNIWIAGGIGITPFLGMARSLSPNDGYSVDLYYSLVERSDAPFLEELTEIAKQNPNFHFYPWFSKESGFLNADAIVKQSEGVVGKEVFLCGPPPMMKSIKAQFKKYSVPTNSVHSEEFALS